MLRDSLLCTIHSTGEGALVYPEDGCMVVNVTTAMSEYDHCHGILVEAFIDDSSAR